ncbi:hypothetical protein RRG08_036620 [Elysia crispata]|uniref:Uncharacterized protein n=1 Tax=Elysia crispata TaxID=231223 RepID=A0AAE1A378_9GAST|nr:hypothetical protein RRG08_036620 [Elysia crispata]
MSDIVIRMRIIPILRHHQNSSQRTDQEVDFSEEEEIFVLEETKVGFVVQLSGTLERRFFCPSMRSRLQDCRLEECAEGGLVWAGHDVHGQRPHRSCIVPVGARVLHKDGYSHVPLCTCLGVMAALEDLDLWKIRLTRNQDTDCFLRLKSIPKKHKPFDEIYDFTEADSLLERSPFSTTLSDEPGSRRLLKRLARISQSCPDDGGLDFQVCFILTDADKDREMESKSCLRWGLPDHNGSLASIVFISSNQQSGSAQDERVQLRDDMTKVAFMEASDLMATGEKPEHCVLVLVS